MNLLTWLFPSSYIQPPFLNLLSLLTHRTGEFHIRVGGNTQETARLVDSLADHKMIEKQSIDPNNPVSLFCVLLGSWTNSTMTPRLQRRR